MTCPRSHSCHGPSWDVSPCLVSLPCSGDFSVSQAQFRAVTLYTQLSSCTDSPAFEMREPLSEWRALGFGSMLGLSLPCGQTACSVLHALDRPTDRRALEFWPNFFVYNAFFPGKPRRVTVYSEVISPALAPPLLLCPLPPSHWKARESRFVREKFSKSLRRAGAEAAPGRAGPESPCGPAPEGLGGREELSVFSCPGRCAPPPILQLHFERLSFCSLSVVLPPISMD